MDQDFKKGDYIMYDRFPGMHKPLSGVLVELNTVRGIKGAWVVCNGVAYFAPFSKLEVVYYE